MAVREIHTVYSPLYFFLKLLLITFDDKKYFFPNPSRCHMDAESQRSIDISYYIIRQHQRTYIGPRVVFGEPAVQTGWHPCLVHGLWLIGVAKRSRGPRRQCLCLRGLCEDILHSRRDGGAHGAAGSVRLWFNLCGLVAHRPAVIHRRFDSREFPFFIQRTLNIIV